MSTKIAKADADAMNSLFEMGAKTAAAVGEDKGIQAFKDHAEYEATLESVLSEDGKQSWDPNSMLLD